MTLARVIDACEGGALVEWGPLQAGGSNLSPPRKCRLSQIKSIITLRQAIKTLVHQTAGRSMIRGLFLAGLILGLSAGASAATFLADAVCVGGMSDPHEGIGEVEPGGRAFVLFRVQLPK